MSLESERVTNLTKSTGWLERSRRPPYAHQIVGVEWLVQEVDPEANRVFPGCHFLADDMRLGKTKQVIDAAQILFEQGTIRRVIVVCPSPVRSVWFDPEFGELRKHLWEDLPSVISEYHVHRNNWTWGEGAIRLEWIITNYEFIGFGVEKVKKNWTGWNLDPLLSIVTDKTMLVLDESSWIKSHKAKRSRACLTLRRPSGRVVLLNGTPISQSPGDMYSQAFMLDHRILGCSTQFEFKARYAKQKTMHARGRSFQKLLGWQNLEDLQERMAPYVMRRIRSECLDLPPKLDPVAMCVTLDKKTWKLYHDMREDLMVWLTENTSVSGAQAAVRVMRLAQLTSGFLGGVEEENECTKCQGEPSEEPCDLCGGTGFVTKKLPTEEVGREKLDALLEWIETRLEQDPEFRMLIWCRFRPELFRLLAEIREKFPQIICEAIHGGQKKDERDAALRLMRPGNVYSGPAILIGTQGTGSVGLDMAGAHEVVYLSNGNSLFQRRQSEDRPHGPGQTQPVSYHDILAEGPDGQRTIDHKILRALRDRQELADWTTSAWAAVLKEEGKEDANSRS